MPSLSRRRFLTMATVGVPLAVAGVPADTVLDRGHVTGLLARDPERVTPSGAARLHGFVQPLLWSEAQPTPGGPISAAAVATLASAVSLARTRGYPRLKLRLLAGRNAPDWALQLGGGPLTGWLEPENDETVTVPRWWAPEFLDAYASFVGALAPHLTDPEWCDVTVSGSCTVFAEPCVHQLGVAENRSKALAAGFTPAADEAALRKVISDQHAVLSPLGISSSVAYNPLQSIDARGRLTTLPGTTLAVMDFQRDLAGGFGIWENNSLIAKRLPDGATQQTREDYQPMYDHMIAGAAQGHPVQFQTATLAKILAAGGTPYDTASWVADNGGISVELPGGWEREGITAAQAADLNSRMAANDQ